MFSYSVTEVLDRGNNVMGTMDGSDLIVIKAKRQTETATLVATGILEGNENAPSVPYAST
jgi:hypothetical protein